LTAAPARPPLTVFHLRANRLFWIIGAYICCAKKKKKINTTVITKTGAGTTHSTARGKSQSLGLLDTIAVLLVSLVVVGMIFLFGHFLQQEASWLD